MKRALWHKLANHCFRRILKLDIPIDLGGKFTASIHRPMFVCRGLTGAGGVREGVVLLVCGVFGVFEALAS